MALAEGLPAQPGSSVTLCQSALLLIACARVPRRSHSRTTTRSQKPLRVSPSGHIARGILSTKTTVLGDDTLQHCASV